MTETFETIHIFFATRKLHYYYSTSIFFHFPFEKNPFYTVILLFVKFFTS